MENCLNCGKKLVKKSDKCRVERKFCDQKCIEEYKKKERKKNLLQKTCLWCKTEYETKFPTQRFGSDVCTRKFNTVRQRIYNIFQFDRAKQEKEIKSLEELGKFYRFPSEFEDLNQFYGLKGKKP